MTGPIPFEVVQRVWPNAAPPTPVLHAPWPKHVLVVAFRTARHGGGALTFGEARLLGGEFDHRWAFYGRGMRASQARNFFGRDGAVPILGLEDFLEHAFWQSCYRPQLRAACVTWSVPAFVSSSAWRVDARKDWFRFTLFTWRRGDEVLPNLYRSKIRVTPSSATRALVQFEDRRDPDPQDFVVGSDGKRRQYRGRFNSLAQLGYVLSGEDQLILPQALSLWGIATARPTGGADGIVAELDAICSLYEAMLEDLKRWEA